MKNNSLRKIASLLVGIVLLPILFVAVIEVNSLTDNEKMIKEVYEKQLNTILFSINQYSEDIVNSWGNEIEDLYKKEDKTDSQFHNFLLRNSAIEEIFFCKYSDKSFIRFALKNKVNDFKKCTTLLEKNKQVISRLFEYLKNNYRKLEPINNDLDSYIIFAMKYEDEEIIAGIKIETSALITQTLSPKLQEIAQEDIVISCVNSITKDIIYSTEAYNDWKLQIEKPLWILPNIDIAISLKGRTIQGLVTERSITNLSLILLLTLFLLIAVYLVYRNIRKEVKFAQIKSDFVSNVSHELRTPLALISMFAETLELNRVKSEEKRNEYYKIISQETNRLSRIVNNMLNFSKMEAGKREYKFTDVNLNTLLGEVLDTYKFHLKNKGFTVEFISSTNPMIISADKEALGEAFINLLDNAVKYSEAEKNIIVRTDSQNDKTFFEVKDFGIGISDEDKKKIFDKFYRVTSGLVHNTKGTGMGLSIVKHIVDAHQGLIEVESIPTKGSTFRILLPNRVAEKENGQNTDS